VNIVAGGLDVEVNRVGLTDGAGVLLDLLATDRVERGLVGLADGLRVHGHLLELLLGGDCCGAPVYGSRRAAGVQR
jgi:hypothetical protein